MNWWKNCSFLYFVTASSIVEKLLSLVINVIAQNGIFFLFQWNHSEISTEQRDLNSFCNRLILRKAVSISSSRQVVLCQVNFLFLLQDAAMPYLLIKLTVIQNRSSPLRFDF